MLLQCSYPQRLSAHHLVFQTLFANRLTFFVIYAFILWRHLPSSCCLHLVPPSVVVFNVLQISFSGFLPEPFEISKNGLLHLTLHTSAQNILKFQVPRSKALGGVWAQSSKIRAILYYYRCHRNKNYKHKETSHQQCSCSMRNIKMSPKRPFDLICFSMPPGDAL